MISINDMTVLTMFTRFPDMDESEADQYINTLQDPSNIPICRAILGRIDKEDLNSVSRRTFDQLISWAADQTRRTRNEQWTARRQGQETRLAMKLTRLYERGIISGKTLFMYGISGEMPERAKFMSMTSEEQEQFWSERLSRRFGPQWREVVQDLHSTKKSNWTSEGF